MLTRKGGSKSSWGLGLKAEPHPLDRVLGQNLAAKRRECKLSREALAAMIRMPASWIDAYEAGEERVLVQHLFTFAQAFGVTPGAFFEGL